MACAAESVHPVRSMPCDGSHVFRSSTAPSRQSTARDPLMPTIEPPSPEHADAKTCGNPGSPGSSCTPAAVHWNEITAPDVFDIAWPTTVEPSRDNDASTNLLYPAGVGTSSVPSAADRR